MRCHHSCLGFALAALVFSNGYLATSTSARAQDGPKERASDNSTGRVDFDHPGGGTPAVEVDLPAGLFGDVVGLGDAAISGVAEALLKAPTADEGTRADVKIATDQLAAIRTIIGSVQGAVGEVRLRVYKDAEGLDAGAIAEHYAAKLNGSAWNKIVHVRDGEKGATVFLMRQDGAIRGAFAVATEGRQLVLANVLCDISPERVKQITQQATSMGLELGGNEALHEIVEEIRGR